MSDEIETPVNCFECGDVWDSNSMYYLIYADQLICPDCMRVIDGNDYIQGAEQ
jgi:hypothetical protein